MNQKSERPWGKWEKLYEETGMWVKKITVLPGQRLSLQYHLNRREEWTIIKGTGDVTLDHCKFNVWEGKHISIGFRQVHRIHNTGDSELVFVEVALGYPNEEDIVRVEDDYGR